MERIWKWIKRNPAWATLALVVLLAGAGFLQRYSTTPARLPRQRAAAGESSPPLALHRAAELWAAGRTSLALAHYALLLRQNPSNVLAAQHLVSILSQHAFVLPTTITLAQDDHALVVGYSLEGRHIWTRSFDDTLQLWDAHTGQPLISPYKPNPIPCIYSPTPDGLCWVARTGTNQNAPEIGPGELEAGWLSVPEPTRSTAAPSSRAPNIRKVQIALDAAKNEVHSLSDHGARLLTASADNAVSIWDVASGQLYRRWSIPADSLTSGDLAPGADRAVLLTSAGARIWDTTNAQPAGPLLQGSEKVQSIVYSPDGRWIAGWSDDSDVFLWNARDGSLHSVIRDWSRHLGESPQFSADGQWLLMTGVGGTARLWDAATGYPVTPVLFHFYATVKVQAVADLSFDRRWLATLVPNYDQTLRLWDVPRAQLLNSPIHVPADEAIFSPDGQQLLTLASKEAVRIWRFRSDETAWLPRHYTGALSPVKALPAENRVLVVRRDTNGVAGLMDLNLGSWLTRLPNSETNTIFASLSPSGRLFATIHRDGNIKVWEAPPGRLVATLTAQPDETRGVEFSADSTRLLAICGAARVRVWETVSGRLLRADIAHEHAILQARFSPDGSRVATASRDQTARLWDIRTGRALLRPFRHESRVTSVQFSPDGHKLLTTCEGQAQLWDLTTGRQIFPGLRHEYHYVEDHMDEYLEMFACFSPDGCRLATASGFTVRTWDAHRGTALVEPLVHPTFVKGVAFSPDGTRLLTTCADGAARIWDARTGHPLAEPFRHRGMTYHFDAAWSADGRWIVTALPQEYWTRRLSLWEVPAAPLPVPPKLLDLAEALGGLRLDKQGMEQPVPWTEILTLQERLTTASEQINYTRWVKWFFSEGPSRTLSPSQRRTVADEVAELLAENTPDALGQAWQLAPTDPAVRTRLAGQPGRGL